MPIVDVYSSRLKKGQSASDVWLYDAIPDALRVQVANLVGGALGSINGHPNTQDFYQWICDSVAHEHGRERLTRQDFDERPWSQVRTSIRTETDILVWLDLVELSFRFIANVPQVARQPIKSKSMSSPTFRRAEAPFV